MSAEGAIAWAKAGVLNDAEAFVERTSELLHDESQAPVTSNL